jgi:ankyrin repeat protein
MTTPRSGRISAAWGRRAEQLSLGMALLLLAALAVHAAAQGKAQALTSAAAAGDLAKVRSLLQSGANFNAKDDQGRTALLNAADAGHMEVVYALIDAKVDLNATDRNGLSALIAAARRSDVDMARVLLSAGADPNLGHRAYGTALEIAERNGEQGLITLLRAHGARGAGKSVGDVVCVRLWKGQGYCGTVTAVAGLRWTLRVTRIVGCAQGCAPDPCSLGRTVGGDQAGSVQVNDEMRVEGACLTHAGVLPDSR